MSIALPQLPYAYDALAPIIDEQTMRIHHTKHHQGYTDKYNTAIAGTAYENNDVEDVLRNLQSVPEDIRTAVRNNGGGYVNHAMFWESMTPGGSDMPQTLCDALCEAFGSVGKFKELFSKNASGQFGSGWAWLCVATDGSLKLCATPNQDNPMMEGAGCGCTPILGLDVWEHAYYLSYQNARGDYIEKWRNVVNRNVVADRLAKARA